MFKKTLIPFVLTVILTGCSTTSGLAPVVSHSGFDDAKTVHIQPHGNDCEGMSMICSGIGAQWSQSSPDSVVLLIHISNDTVGISGAQLNIDGEIFNLKKTPGVTDIEVSGSNGVYMKSSTKGFVSDIDVVRKILASERTWLRISTPTGYIEDRVIDGNKDSKAYHALKRFMHSIES